MIISKQEFINIFQKFAQNCVIERDVYKLLQIKNYQNIFTENTNIFFDKLINQIISSEYCLDIVNEYLYSDPIIMGNLDRTQNSLKIDNEIISNLEELYNFIEKQHGFSTNYRTSN